MSDHRTDCDRFEAWLLESDSEADATGWAAHLESCAGCREQWSAHRMLVATFASKGIPELSPSFQSGLDRKLDAAMRVAPLRGWRLAALVGYVVAASAMLRRILVESSTAPTSIDPSSPWTMAIAMLLVPLTLWLAAAATRVLPSQHSRGTYLPAL